jgi:hypothetical protein
LEYIKGEKNIVADVLSRLPTAELFLIDEEEDFPLNLRLIAEYQSTDETLQKNLQSQKLGYKKIMRETVKLYVHQQHETIYVPGPLHASLLQWYHLTLQHPGIKCMQATLKENFTGLE